MKNKLILTAFTVFVTILFVSVIFILLNQNSKLQSLVDKQNVILNNYSSTDTLLNKGRVDLMNSIDDFFENVPTYKDGERVTPLDFVIYHNEVLDTLRMYKDIVNYSRRNYGTNIHRIWETDSTYYTGAPNTTRADSAQLTYKYFQDRINKNNDGSWTIRTGTYEEEYDDLLDDYRELQKENSELRNKYVSLAKEQIEMSKRFRNYIDDKNKLLKDFAEKGLIELDSTSSDSTLIIKY